MVPLPGFEGGILSLKTIANAREKTVKECAGFDGKQFSTSLPPEVGLDQTAAKSTNQSEIQYPPSMLVDGPNAVNAKGDQGTNISFDSAIGSDICTNIPPSPASTILSASKRTILCNGALDKNDPLHCVLTQTPNFKSPPCDAISIRFMGRQNNFEGTLLRGVGGCGEGSGSNGSILDNPTLRDVFSPNEPMFLVYSEGITDGRRTTLGVLNWCPEALTAKMKIRQASALTGILHSVASSSVLVIKLFAADYDDLRSIRPVQLDFGCDRRIRRPM